MNNIVNGKREGIWMIYHENGKLCYKGEYNNGKQVGYWESYYTNGILAYEGKYENGLKEGFWKTYYNNGKINVLSRELFWYYSTVS